MSTTEIHRINIQLECCCEDLSNISSSILKLERQKLCKYSIIERRNFATIPSNIALHRSMVAFISDMQLHLFHLQLPYRLHLNATVYLCLFYPQLHLISMPRGTTVSISYPQVHYISLSYPLFSLSNVLNPI